MIILTLILLNIALSQVTNITQGITYSSITEAVAPEVVNDYDIIEVSPQTYYERIVIWSPLTLRGLEGARIDASGLMQAIIVAADDVIISGFEIIGNELTVAGIEVTGGCENIVIDNNVIHGMSLPNPANSSNFSYGVLAYGAENVPNPPYNLTISNNEIYETSGSGISLGSYTNNTTIINNFIHDITPVEYQDDYVSVGIMGSYSNEVEITGNTFTNVTSSTSFSLSNGIVENNIYNDTSILLSSVFYITDENDGFDFSTSETYFLARSAVSFPLIYMHAYCNSLALAMTLADEGSTIITSEGEEIIQDCNGDWGSNAIILLCGTCTDEYGDVNNDDYVDVLDIITIVNYIYEDIDLDETSICLADLNQDTEINILDVVQLVNQILL